MKEIKVVQIGTGKMSIYTMQFVYEKGEKIVGAFDINEKLIGKDISTIMGGEKKNVLIEHIDNLEKRLQELKPDIAIVTTMSLLNDVYNVLLTCAKYGVNAITTCEEAFDSYNSNPVKTKMIDEIAKENHCTITGSGYQDIYWGNLISTLASSINKITKIKGSSSYNVEDYGLALAEAHGAGLTADEFDISIASNDNITNEQRQKLINEGSFLPSYMWNTNGWLCEKLGLTVISQNQKCIPTFHTENIHSETLEMDIKKGMATGMRAVVTTETEEGITIESECVGKVYSKDDFDKNEWTIYGEPNTNIVVNRPDTVLLTCATVVNRIPDVINAKSGFTLTCHMKELKYRTKPLHEYLK